MNYQRPELIDRLASEYALGTLRGPALRRFRRLMQQSPQIRQAVQQWETRLAALAVSVPPVAPPAKTLLAIEAQLGWATKPRASLWSWLRPAMVFSVGLVIGVGAVMLQPQRFVSLDALAQREQALPQSYVGLLTDREGRPTVLASSTRQGTRMTIKLLRPLDVPTGKVLQLWALPQDEAGKPLAAFPLGVVPATAKGGFEMAASAESLLSNVTRLGVTLQEAPAAAGDAPPASAEAFVLTGHCVKLW
ncbi:anti-sigma factor [Viridibacterium curvum]|uniref:Anti-sigma K factor RskA C-terminal domain-containing protein n=1 Tax=Viridibacterium curvum TaxID=1101404 RepID=A0ABP9QRH4_9RHOO